MGRPSGVGVDSDPFCVDAVRTLGSLVVTYDPSTPNNYGVNLENVGVPPDVWVKNTPRDEVKKIDRELKTAIEEALTMLKDVKLKISSENQCALWAIQTNSVTRIERMERRDADQIRVPSLDPLDPCSAVCLSPLAN